MTAYIINIKGFMNKKFSTPAEESVMSVNTTTATVEGKELAKDQILVFIS